MRGLQEAIGHYVGRADDDLIEIKFVVQAYARSWACDLVLANVRVNSILAGWLETQCQIDLWLTPESAQGLLRPQSLRRKLVPNGILNIVLFFIPQQSGACAN